MPELDKNLFAGDADLDSDEARGAEVRNLGTDINRKLSNSGWNGVEAVGCIGLVLSTDNERVERGTLIVKGQLEEEPIRIEANKIWEDANKNVMLSLKLNNEDIFTFNATGLTSDILPQENIHHGVVLMREDRAPRPVLEGEYEGLGIGNFCLRMACTISKSSSVRKGVVLKYTVLIFPVSKDDMLATYELAQSPAWPGMRVMDGELAVWRRPATKWGCPILPFIMPGAPFEQLPRLPASDEIRHVIATIMERGVVPETGRTGAALLTKWRKLANNPADLSERAGPVTWPKTRPAAIAQGKSCHINYLITREQRGGEGKRRNFNLRDSKCYRGESFCH